MYARSVTQSESALGDPMDYGPPGMCPWVLRQILGELPCPAQRSPDSKIEPCLLHLLHWQEVLLPLAPREVRYTANSSACTAETNFVNQLLTNKKIFKNIIAYLFPNFPTSFSL